ncbi:outer membrane lipid asymmetry maintenance protein MlaD [Desulforegula conservatrix]|uniref:outer membrane lipid asymmetry maintenance protein MlaD n=1 Tax=Desulforegula conservatrix TaxID=153026 RepID=UPI0003F85735|nr:outer membrane lipid asymmetry maintenance protein MlaD [Desulforegula conservatrix]
MKKSYVEFTVGLFMLIGIISISYMAIKLGKMEMMDTDYYFLKARFQSVSGLKKGASVEMAGVEVGRVGDIAFDAKKQDAIVTLKITNTIPVSSDVIASVKTAGLIGDKFIKLTPGGAEDNLKSGDTINDTESALDIEELISKYVFGGV